MFNAAVQPLISTITNPNNNEQHSFPKHLGNVLGTHDIDKLIVRIHPNYKQNWDYIPLRSTVESTNEVAVKVLEISHNGSIKISDPMGRITVLESTWNDHYWCRKEELLLHFIKDSKTNNSSDSPEKQTMQNSSKISEELKKSILDQYSSDITSKKPEEVLGVQKTASSKEATQAFRKLSLIYHPDKAGKEEEFKALSEAYATFISEKEHPYPPPTLWETIVGLFVNCFTKKHHQDY